MRGASPLCDTLYKIFKLSSVSLYPNDAYIFSLQGRIIGRRVSPFGQSVFAWSADLLASTSSLLWPTGIVHLQLEKVYNSLCTFLGSDQCLFSKMIQEDDDR